MNHGRQWPNLFTKMYTMMLSMMKMASTSTIMMRTSGIIFSTILSCKWLTSATQLTSSTSCTMCVWTQRPTPWRGFSILSRLSASRLTWEVRLLLHHCSPLSRDSVFTSNFMAPFCLDGPQLYPYLPMTCRFPAIKYRKWSYSARAISFALKLMKLITTEMFK